MVKDKRLYITCITLIIHIFNENHIRGSTVTKVHVGVLKENYQFCFHYYNSVELNKVTTDTFTGHKRTFRQDIRKIVKRQKCYFISKTRLL